MGDEEYLEDVDEKDARTVTVVSDLEEGHGAGTDDLQIISIVKRVDSVREKSYVVDLTKETPPRPSSATIPLPPAPDVIALGAFSSAAFTCTPKCSICLGETMNRPTATVCGHLYCESCIKLALRQTGACPACRRKLKSKDIHRIYL